MAVVLFCSLVVGAPSPELPLAECKATVSGWNRAWADRFVAQGPEPEGKPASLWTARESFGKIAVLTKQFELTKERKYLDRAVREMRFAASRNDWQPSSFLTTSEYLMGVGVGLIRLGPQMSPSDLQPIREALINKGLAPALAAYRKKEEWTTRTNNWGQVCSSGVLLGLLAAPDFRDRTELQEAALRQFRQGTDYLGIAGISPEGPTYWRYGWNALWLADLEWKRAKSESLINRVQPDIAALAAFSLRAPSGRAFNFGDSSESFPITPFMLDYAQRDARSEVISVYSADLKGQLSTRGPWNEEWRFLPLLLDVADQPYPPPFFGGSAPIGATTGNGDMTLFTVVNAIFRGKTTPWLGVKSGSNAEPHAHLDLGSFVYEASGIRWSIDLGKDEYDLPGYFEGRERGRRWSYTRTGTLSHSTLSFNGKNQRVSSRASSWHRVLKDGLRSAGTDLSQAYAAWAKSVKREFELEDSGELRIMDTIEGCKSGGRWAMTTAATISLESQTAILKQEGKRLKATLVRPQGIQWSVGDLTPKSPRENPNAGFCQLILEFPKGTTAIEVRLTPMN